MNINVLKWIENINKINYIKPSNPIDVRYKDKGTWHCTAVIRLNLSLIQEIK